MLIPTHSVTGRETPSLPVCLASEGREASRQEEESQRKGVTKDFNQSGSDGVDLSCSSDREPLFPGTRVGERSDG